MLQQQCAILTISLLFSIPIFANTTPSPHPNEPKTMPYGDNPSLGRVLLYKTGQGMQNLGDSIQHGSEKASSKISKSWDEAKVYSAEQSQVIQEKAETVKERTSQKLQDTKDAIVGTNDGTVPITRGELSQSSSN